MKTAKISTKQLAISALLLALTVVFTRLIAINTSLMKIGFGFAAIALCAMLYGPWWTMLVAALADFVGALLFPTGAYFPGFTATAALTGLIFGLFLYKRKITWLRAFLGALTECALVTLIMNTLMINWVFGTPLKVLLVSRIPQFFIMLAIEMLVIRALGASKLIQRQIK